MPYTGHIPRFFPMHPIGTSLQRDRQDGDDHLETRSGIQTHVPRASTKHALENFMLPPLDAEGKTIFESYVHGHRVGPDSGVTSPNYPPVPQTTAQTFLALAAFFSALRIPNSANESCGLSMSTAASVGSLGDAIAPSDSARPVAQRNIGGQPVSECYRMRRSPRIDSSTELNSAPVDELDSERLEQKTKLYTRCGIDAQGKIERPVVKHVTAGDKDVSPCTTSFSPPSHYSIRRLQKLATIIRNRDAVTTRQRVDQLNKFARHCLVGPPAPAQGDEHKIRVHIHLDGDVVRAGIPDETIRSYFSQYEREMCLVGDFDINYHIQRLPSLLSAQQSAGWPGGWLRRFGRHLAKDTEIKCGKNDKHIILTTRMLSIAGTSVPGQYFLGGSIGTVVIDVHKEEFTQYVLAHEMGHGNGLEHPEGENKGTMVPDLRRINAGLTAEELVVARRYFSLNESNGDRCYRDGVGVRGSPQA
ncbi:hypothetical protein [Paraburkholderia humisilvae]|uniref:Uncharacterized protein n=1 Tax=Paraburkholderia humisilvae TaxID=627669 RepID=A0A6J5F822_9BURK|nr:hypothetical protein [Paraburkholderia humisilvae]CAB3774654.1 hypothetical protein LMG29542_08032 [Paraburkholderia humisilvae]